MPFLSFFNLIMKASLSAKFFIWKLVFIHMQTKLSFERSLAFIMRFTATRIGHFILYWIGLLLSTFIDRFSAAKTLGIWSKLYWTFYVCVEDLFLWYVLNCYLIVCLIGKLVSQWLLVLWFPMYSTVFSRKLDISVGWCLTWSSFSISFLINTKKKICFCRYLQNFLHPMKVRVIVFL